MKVEDIDAGKLARFVEQEMERRLSWAANALYIAGQPPRAAVRDEEAIDYGMGRSEAARAVVMLHLFVASDGAKLDRVSAELALRFVWRWIYAPPFTTTSHADQVPVVFLGREGAYTKGDESKGVEERQLGHLMFRASRMLSTQRR